MPNFNQPVEPMFIALSIGAIFIGVGIGIAAAVLNVYKAYSKQYKAYEELAKEKRYKIQKALEDDEDEDEFEKHY